jgi:aryl-alcohol dehydrogenase-like predicted oxidoreductase
MRLRALGATGLTVSEFGFGAWAIGGSSRVWAYGPVEDKVSLSALRRALELGCTLFDTADIYGCGHSEQLLGEALGACRGRVVLATKAGFDFYHGEIRPNFDAAYLRMALYQSLRRLRTDYVDIFQLHNPPLDVLYDGRVADELMRLRSRGQARALGVSAAAPADAAMMLTVDWVEVVQVPFNALASEAEWLVFPAAARRNIGVLVREPLANGLLSGKYGVSARFQETDVRSLHGPGTLAAALSAANALQPYRRPGETTAQVALRYARTPRAVSAVLCGCKTPQQAEENFTAGAESRQKRAGATGSD